MVPKYFVILANGLEYNCLSVIAIIELAPRGWVGVIKSFMSEEKMQALTYW